MDIDGKGAGEAIAYVILRAHDVGNASEDLRLVFFHPQQFSQGEVWQCRIAGQLDQAFAADLRVQPVALRAGALVAPD